MERTHRNFLRILLVTALLRQAFVFAAEESSKENEDTLIQQVRSEGVGTRSAIPDILPRGPTLKQRGKVTLTRMESGNEAYVAFDAEKDTIIESVPQEPVQTAPGFPMLPERMLIRSGNRVVLREGQFLPSLQDGVVVRFVGKLSFHGCSFDGERNWPLSFVVLEKLGFVYLHGKGTVVLKDGKRIQLSGEPPGSRPSAVPPQGGPAAPLTLLEVAKQGDVAMVRAFLAAGADVNASNELGLTPLMLAAAEGRTGVVEALVTNGAQVNAKNKGGLTALMFAAMRGHRETIDVLTAGEADLNAQDNLGGYTALMLAALHGHNGAVHSLLGAGSEVNTRSRMGLTALILAAWKGHAAIVETLLAKGADASAKDNQGRTALTAAQGQHPAVVELLKKAAADPQGSAKQRKPLAAPTGKTGGPSPKLAPQSVATKPKITVPEKVTTALDLTIAIAAKMADHFGSCVLSQRAQNLIEDSGLQGALGIRKPGTTMAPAAGGCWVFRFGEEWGSPVTLFTDKIPNVEFRNGQIGLVGGEIFVKEGTAARIADKVYVFEGGQWREDVAKP